MASARSREWGRAGRRRTGARVRNRREAWGPGGRGRKRRKTGGAFRSGGQNHGEADSRER